MRTLILAFSSILAIGLSVESFAQSSPVPQQPVAAPPAVSPFLQFAAQEAPRKSDLLPLHDPSKPKPIEIVIGTPGGGQFAHMQTGAPNARLECIVPSSFRKDDRF